MKQILLLFALCAAAGTAQATVTPSILKPTHASHKGIRIDANRYDKMECGQKTIVTPRSTKNQQRAMAADMVTVTLNYDCDSESYPLGFSVISAENGITHADYDWSSYTTSLQVPAGTYDIMANYMSNWGEVYYVIHENVEILTDQTVSLPQSEATHPLTVRSVDHEGNPLYMAIYNENYQQVDPGTAEDFSALSSLVLKGVGDISLVIGGGYKYEGHEADFYFSDLSSRYKLCEAREIGIGVDWWFNRYEVEDLTNATEVVNDASRFIHYEQEFEPTPEWSDDEEAHVPGYNMIMVLDGEALIGQVSYIPGCVQDKCTTSFYLDLPLGKEGADQFNVLVKPMYSDYLYVEDWDGYPWEEYYFTQGPSVYGDKDGIFVVNAGYDVNGGFNARPNTISQLYPGHPAFSYPIELAEGAVYGNNCPINSQRYELWGEDLYLTPSYVGRYGEFREADLYVAMPDESASGNTLKVNLYNYNVLVDGLAGSNVTELSLQMDQEDFEAPTLQMLQFKNGAGQVTDRFEQAAGSVMEFAGGDFTRIAAGWSGYYECTSAQAKAFYAPYGEDDWTELTVSEDPELFFTPGFGAFFRCSLADVQGAGEDGWYDIRIELTDASGNVQVQTIRPAFQLLTATSIEHNGIPSAAEQATSRKQIQHGNLVIVNGGHEYNAIGMKTK